MSIEYLNEFIKKSLIHYDNQCMNYLPILKIEPENVKFNVTFTEITFIYNDKEKTFDCEILGYFDNQNNIWVWGWLLSELNSDQILLSRELLNYGLKLEPSSNSIEHFYIKSLLVNSRVKIEEAVQLETNLAICSYLTKKKISFIYPRKRYLNNEKSSYVTFYYFIK